MADPLRHHIGDKAGHDAGVILVAAGPGQIDSDEGQTDTGGLLGQQLLAHPVHRHSFELLIEGGEQPYYLDGWILPQLMQCPRTILAAAP